MKVAFQPTEIGNCCWVICLLPSTGHQLSLALIQETTYIHQNPYKVGFLPTDLSSYFSCWLKRKGPLNFSLWIESAILWPRRRGSGHSWLQYGHGLILSQDRRNFKRVSCPISCPADSIVPQSWGAAKCLLELNNFTEKSFPGTPITFMFRISLCVSFGYSQS